LDFNIEQALGPVGESLKAAFHDLFSVWLAIQVAEIGIAAAIAATVAGVAQRRIKLVDLTMGWPAPLRLFARLLLEHIGTPVFILAVAIIHAGMLSVTWPSRSYLLGVAESLATAWFVIAMLAGLIRSPLPVSVSRAATAPTIVTCSPSRIQTVPRPITTRQ